MNIYVVSNFDPDKGYNFDQFKETYTKNAHSQLIDFISNWEIPKMNDYKSVIKYQCSDTERLIKWLSTDGIKSITKKTAAQIRSIFWTK